MTRKTAHSSATPVAGRGRAERIHRMIVSFLLIIMLAELPLVLLAGHWLTGFLVALIISITVAPLVFRKRLPVVIPPEFQILAIVFIFASLYLGEVRSFYLRVWWWDIALHTTAGLLLGVVGFLLVYVLNENERIELHMRPRFVALFARLVWRAGIRFARVFLAAVVLLARVVCAAVVLFARVVCAAVFFGDAGILIGNLSVRRARSRILIGRAVFFDRAAVGR